MSSGLRTGDVMFSKRLILPLACAALSVAQTQPPQQKRDLTVEKLDADTARLPKAPVVPRSYAVIVGVSQYPKLTADQQLKFAERDAQSIFTILISPEGGNFKRENVEILTGNKATLANLRAKIDTWLPSVAKEDDRVLIYFAGHGFVFQGKGYLAPYDFDPAHIADTGYPMEQLGRDFGSKIHAKWKILLTDACHSGAISPSDTEQLNSKLSNLTESLFSLTASRARESSFESPELQGGHGVFTYYAVKGLEGAADYNHDGIVTTDELSEYVHTQVREATSGKQNPTSDRASYDPAMWLSYVPANASPATPPAPQFGGFVVEVNKDEVEVFIDGKSIGVLSPGKPMPVPGLAPGQHTVKGVKMGFEPDGPREETVFPGTDSPVSIKILIPRRRNKAASDSFDKGFEFYQKGYEENYKKAATLFEAALRMDSTYSQAAFYLGQTYNALFDEEKAQQYFRKAIEIDPDYLDAHAAYAGMLLDIGDTDEAIRQLNVVLQRQPDHATGLTMLAQAYRLKDLYPQSIEAAQRAIQLTPKNAEPHMWLADSLRLSGKLPEAKAEYLQYLRLSDFDSKLAGKLNYYVLGSLIGFGRKKRAAQHDIWSDLRSLAFFGLCDCDRRSKNYDSAIAYCQKSLAYDARDPYAHYALGLSFMHKANDENNMAALDPAIKHFQLVVDINPDMDEAKMAKRNIATIQAALR
jgi:tetratricopeptide (TPR) repeat protein